eukprot:SM000143S00735  [mRNA]  locus=s143:123643:126016:- [translate_table: standard]
MRYRRSPLAKAGRRRASALRRPERSDDGGHRRGGGAPGRMSVGRPAVDPIHTSAPGGGGGDDVQRTVEEALQELASQLDIAEGTAEAIAWQEEHVGVPLEPFDLPTDPVLQPGQMLQGQVTVKPGVQKFFLSAMIFNRVFRGDHFNITFFECSQWLKYMQYAGVEHIFWYDTAHNWLESQERHLAPYKKSGFVTYHRFHKLIPGHVEDGYHFEQDTSEKHCINNYGATTKWLLIVDVDEYVFTPGDLQPGFLSRYVKTYSQEHPDVSQLLLQCFLFLGNPRKPVSDFLIERYQRRKGRSEGVALGGNSKMKAIIRPKDVFRIYPSEPHFFKMARGKTVAQPSAAIRLNHYWGARLTNFGPDTYDVLEQIQTDDSIQPIVDNLKRPISSLGVS